MRRVWLAFALAAGILASFSAWSMVLHKEGDTLFASGPVGDDYVQFKTALESPDVTRIVFVNSPGGDLWTGMHVARMIAEKNLHTVVAGYCVSACSLLFMAGSERTYSDAFGAGQTMIGIHGAQNKYSGSVATGPNPGIYAFLKMRMGEHFNSTIINKALNDISEANGLLRIFDPQRELRNSTFFCRSGTVSRTDCEAFDGADAVALGVATQPGLTKLDLPPALKPKATAASSDEPRVIANLTAYLDDVTSTLCRNEHCRQAIRDMAAGKGHKALAYQLASDGWGTSFGRSTTSNAFIGALYNCNHTKNRPSRLCEVRYLDIYDWKDEYGRRESRAAEMASKLAIPFNRYSGGEEIGPQTVEVTDVLHLDALNTPTPLAVPGIQTYTTQEVVQAMKSSDPPVIVDVSGAEMTLPGAQPLINGGRVFTDSSREAAYEDRFSGLLWLIAKLPSKPVIFVGKDRGSWEGAVAAVRARKLGHAKAGWYRGGLESWRAAGLPLTAAAVRAVVDP